MSNELKQIRIFISSPGDVAEERALTRKVIERLQGEFFGRIILDPVFWEHEPLRATQTFQEQIVRPSETDIVITILWSRLGTRLPSQFKRPDGSSYESGTEFEFEDAFRSFKKRGSPDLLIYRKTADAKVSLIDKRILLDKLKQKEALDNFFDRWFHDKTEGTLIAAFHPFANSADFEEIFEAHLSKLIKLRLPAEATGEKVPAAIGMWKQGSPFRGLSVFDFDHAPVFFGRTKAVSEIIDNLRNQATSDKAFVLILGMSGGGKSSLVRAGVLPMITQPGVIEGVGLWRYAIMKPGGSSGDLFDGLAASLLQHNALPELGADRSDYKDLARILRETPRAAVPLIKGGLSQAAAQIARAEKLAEQPTARLVLLVDQMEEMFSLESITHNERKKFIEALDALSRSGRVWVIATLRSDFYPRTAELRGLVTLKEGTGQYDLLSPTSAEIGQMIRQPAQAAGLYFEEDTTSNERLDDVLRDASAKNPGALPLLEFTLEELYKQRTDTGMLTYQAYRKLGGVEGALAQRAEEVFVGLEPKVQKALDVELHSLISIAVDDGERISRKYAPLAMVTATPETKACVAAFVKARLFTTDLAADGSAIVSIAHEALLQHWPRLQDWLEKNKENLRIHARVNAAARRWENENRSREFLLSAGKQVGEAEELTKNKNIELTHLETAFIQASIAKGKKIWWMKRAITAALLILTIVASGAAYMAQQERDRARTQAQTAEQVSDFLVGLFEVSDPYETLGDTISAREMLDKGAEKIGKELAGQPEVQATLMNTMGEVYMNLALYEQALPLLEKALATRRQLFGDIHPDVATSLDNLDELYGIKGDLSEAEEFNREALVIWRELHGDEHRNVASNLNSLGTILYKKAKYAEAENYYREALTIYQNLGNKERSNVATVFNNLAKLSNVTGDYSEAEELYGQALSIYRQIFGDEHPFVAITLNNLSELHRRTGDYSKAEKLTREALAIQRKVYVNTHPFVAISLYNLVGLLVRKGEFTEAESLAREALEITRAVYGEGNPEVASGLNNLGYVLREKGEYSEVEDLYKQSLEIYRKAYGDQHPRVAMSLDNSGNLAFKQGKYSESGEFFKESLAIRRMVFGNEHPDVATSLNNLGLIMVKAGNYPEAEEMYREALDIKQKKLPAGHWDTVASMINYGKCLVKLDRFEEAETNLVGSYQLTKAKYPEDHKRIKITLDSVIGLYRVWDKPEKIAEYQAYLPEHSPVSESK